MCPRLDKLMHNFRESSVGNIAYKRLQNDVATARIPPNRPGHNINPNWVSVWRFFAIQDLHDGGDRLARGSRGQLFQLCGSGCDGR